MKLLMYEHIGLKTDGGAYIDRKGSWKYNRFDDEEKKLSD